jgi:DNA-binding phage protein
MQAQQRLKSLKPVSPYNKNPAKALMRCFDRATGEKVSKPKLKTNLDVLAQYHLHPENKFLNGDYLDEEKTHRRHIVAKRIQHIGKEANKWEEQFYTGINPDAQIEYGISAEDRENMLEVVLQAIPTYGASAIAEKAKISRRQIIKIYKRQSLPTNKTLFRLYNAAQNLELSNMNTQKIIEMIKTMIASKIINVSGLAASMEIDKSNLVKMLSGKRQFTPKHIHKLILRFGHQIKFS